MQQRIKILLIILLSFFIFTYLYIFQQPHRDYIGEKANILLSSHELFVQYQKDEELSNKAYLNKLIEVNGTVTSIEKSLSSINILLDNSLFCIFESNISNKYKEGDIIKIKGRCVGYDDIFSQVRLDQCVIID